MRGVLETTGANAPEAWRRHLYLLVAGMRPADAALSEPPLSQDQVDRIMSKRTASLNRKSEAIDDHAADASQSTDVIEATTRAHWWILIVIAGAQLMVVLDSTIMVIALPSAQHTLGFSNADRQWVDHGLHAGLRWFPPPGRPHQRHVRAEADVDDRRPGFALVSAVGGAAQDTLMLIGARGVQGLFGALLAPSVLSLLTSTFTDPKERGKAFGIYATIAIAGSAFGLILGGFLTQYVDWRWCLYVNLPIAALVLFGAFTMIPTRQGVPGVRLDVLGVVLGCGGLVSLVYGLGEAGTSGWGATQVIVGPHPFRRAAGVLHPVAEQGSQPTATRCVSCATGTAPGHF